MKNASALFVLVFAVGALGGCKRIVTYAVEKELGDDAGLAALESSGSGSGGSGGGSTTDACKLITQAEVEAATGKKVVKTESNGNGCAWTLSGGSFKAEDGTSGSVNLQIVPELAMKVVPVLGEQKAIPGLGDKAEWSGGMAPNLRVHKGGQVLNFLLVDPSAMMKNPGLTEKPVGKPSTTGAGDTAVNMEYPELEKTAITLAKDALARY